MNNILIKHSISYDVASSRYASTKGDVIAIVFIGNDISPVYMEM